MDTAINAHYPLIPRDMFLINLKDNQGQAIIEGVVAVVLILIVSTAISVAISTGLSNSQFIKSQSEASKYAQAGIEYMRYLRNTNPSNFESREGIYCMNQDRTFTPGSCSQVNIGGLYKREAEFTQNSVVECSGGTQVKVAVYWSSGKCDPQNRFCHKSQLISCFSKQSGSGTSL